MMQGIYLHIPFCDRLCGYCDFNRQINAAEAFKARYVEALLKDLRQSVQDDPQFKKPTTLYIGGGTPTSLSVPLFHRLLQGITEAIDPSYLREWTVEANPSSLSDDHLALCVNYGVDRLSLGVQAFDAFTLRTLERDHDPALAVERVHKAYTKGVRRLSLDLIYAVPGQSLEAWEKSVTTALSLPITHLSTYGLTIEEGTPLARKYDQGILEPVDDVLAVAMMEATDVLCKQHGMERYELSNYALPKEASMHNTIYWHMEPYLGIGAGATSWQRPSRRVRIYNSLSYIKAVEEGSKVFTEEILKEEDQAFETLMMGLRLKEGVSYEAFYARHKRGIEEIFPTACLRMLEKGWLEKTDTHLRLTHDGTRLANEVFVALLEDLD